MAQLWFNQHRTLRSFSSDVWKIDGFGKPKPGRPKSHTVKIKARTICYFEDNHSLLTCRLQLFHSTNFITQLWHLNDPCSSQWSNKVTFVDLTPFTISFSFTQSGSEWTWWDITKSSNSNTPWNVPERISRPRQTHTSLSLDWMSTSARLFLFIRSAISWFNETTSWCNSRFSRVVSDSFSGLDAVGRDGIIDTGAAEATWSAVMACSTGTGLFRNSKSRSSSVSWGEDFCRTGASLNAKKGRTNQSMKCLSISTITR